jgi:hypothetical protein
VLQARENRAFGETQQLPPRLTLVTAQPANVNASEGMRQWMKYNITANSNRFL